MLAVRAGDALLTAARPAMARRRLCLDSMMMVGGGFVLVIYRPKASACSYTSSWSRMPSAFRGETQLGNADRRKTSSSARLAVVPSAQRARPVRRWPGAIPRNAKEGNH